MLQPYPLRRLPGPPMRPSLVVRSSSGGCTGQLPAILDPPRFGLYPVLVGHSAAPSQPDASVCPCPTPSLVAASASHFMRLFNLPTQQLVYLAFLLYRPTIARELWRCGSLWRLDLDCVLGRGWFWGHSYGYGSPDQIGGCHDADAARKGLGDPAAGLWPWITTSA